MYILNYLVLLALVLLIFSLYENKLKQINSIIWLFITVLLCGWGIIETNYTTSNRYWFNLERDEAILVNRRLGELAGENPAASTSQITLNFNSIQADNQPTIAPQGVLWAEHLFFLSNMSAEEHHRRYFSYLYYQNKDENWLRENLQNCPNEPCRALIGWKINRTLSINPPEKSNDDVAGVSEIVNEYSNFIKNFSSSDASNPTISYIIAPNDNPTDFNKIDLWYKRDKGEQFGKYMLYRVKKLPD